MRDNLTIRKKLLVAMIVLGMAVFVISYSGFRGVFAYRDLAATVSYRATELPITTELTQAVDNLRYQFRNLHPPSTIIEQSDFLERRQIWSNYHFRQGLREVTDILTRYNAQISSSALEDPFLSDRSEEQRMVSQISRLINSISQRHRVSGIMDPNRIAHAARRPGGTSFACKKTSYVPAKSHGQLSRRCSCQIPNMDCPHH